MPDYQQILIGDTAIEYMRLDGAVDKPSIVLLHEGLGCVALWRDFPQLLHDICGYSVIAYSRAGYGGSSAALLPRPIDHMRREAQVFLPDFLAAMGVKQAIFLGHSDGATVALEAAAARLPALDALILIAPHVFVEDFALVAIRTMNERFSEDNLREKLRRYHGSNVDIAFRGWCDTWLDPEFKHWSMESEL
ncbi:MAG: alpha/beta hydrolase [Pseudomonadota bacterium]